MKVNEIVRDILAECRVEGNVLMLPDRQLDRKTYTEVNKVLEAMGGKWNRKAKGHVFDHSPEATLEDIILSGEYTDTKKELQFFETPEDLAVKLCDMADITPECSAMEPSAGKGRIADEIHKRNPKSIVCFEINPDNKIAKKNGYDCCNWSSHESGGQIKVTFKKRKECKCDDEAGKSCNCGIQL